MGWFSKKRPRLVAEQAGLPANLGTVIAEFGKATVMGQGFAVLPTDLTVTLWQLSERDRNLFYAVLAEAAEPQGEWGWIGAARAVKDLGPYGYTNDEGYTTIMKPATAALRRMGAPLAPLEADWWDAHHPGEPFRP